MSRARKCPPTAPEPAQQHNGNGWSAWWKMLSLGAIGAVVALASVLYGDVRSSQADLEARVRAAETRQAVAEATKVDVERRLQAVEGQLRELNFNVAELLRRSAAVK